MGGLWEYEDSRCEVRAGLSREVQEGPQAAHKKALLMICIGA